MALALGSGCLVRWPDSEKCTPWMAARGATMAAGPAHECSTRPRGKGPSSRSTANSAPAARTQCTCGGEGARV